MWREYRGRPSNIPDLQQTAEATIRANCKARRAKPSRPIKDIIRPFPNISSWRFRRHFWLVPNQNSQAAMQKFLTEVAQAKDFNMDEAIDVSYAKIDDELAKASLPWEDAAHGRRKTSVSINVPAGEKRSKSARRNRRTTCEDADDEDDAPELGAGSSTAVRKFDIPEFITAPYLKLCSPPSALRRTCTTSHSKSMSRRHIKMTMGHPA